jgi:crotonobetainyl-CoA:carnitine CoA-transferase CaiB-like acyl-CoA transferase
VGEAVQALQDHDVPCAPVRTPKEAIEWPHLRGRGMVGPLRRTDGRETGVAAAAFPLKFSRSAAAHDAPAPEPGAHTAEVLERLLNLPAKEVDRLRARGVV